MPSSKPVNSAPPAAPAYAPPAPRAPAREAAPVREPGRPTWRSIALVAVFALATIAAVDAAAWRLSPPVFRAEVQDGVAKLAASDPDVLVLGSSHARTFIAVGDEIARRTGGGRSLVAVPVEAGKLTSYAWVLEHRLRPLVEESREGRRVRSRLSQFVLLTEWWDSCPAAGGISTNLPSRAWTWREFAADVARNGVTDYNRNYLQTRWSRLMRPSALVQDRGQQRVPIAIRTRLGLTDPSREPVRVQERLVEWRAMIADGDRCIGNAEQMAAFASILDWARGAGLETTVILFPRKPGTLTDEGRATTLARFARMAEATAAAHGARVIDYTDRTPLGDDDFMDDFDHVTLDGNRKFAAWALDRELGTLLGAPAPGRVAAAEGGR